MLDYMTPWPSSSSHLTWCILSTHTSTHAIPIALLILKHCIITRMSYIARAPMLRKEPYPCLSVACTKLTLSNPSDLAADTLTHACSSSCPTGRTRCHDHVHMFCCCLPCVRVY